MLGIDDGGGGGGDDDPIPKSQYNIMVECKDEAQQQELYEQLTKKGFECQLLTL